MTLTSRTILCLLLMTLTIPLISPNCSLPAVAGQEAKWREAEPVRVISQSTADWGRILFDDLNGTNTNGLRIRSVLGSGWIAGFQDFDDIMDVGSKIPWPDEVYGQIVVRHGDMVAFFKGLRDFHPSEIYADLILDVDVSQSQVYVWLMSGGNGTTTFEITSLATGGTIWRDIIVGNGVTQQVRRVMSPQGFFHAGRSENFFVIAWLSIAIIVVILLNFPVLELLRRGIRNVKRNRKQRPRR